MLKLSTLWNFEEARRSAVSNLPFTDVDHPVTRIELAMTYKVRQWFLPALQKLATQEHRLGTEDAQRLGLEFSLKVSELRGKVQGFERAKGVTHSSTWTVPTPATVPVTDFIKELFPAAIMMGPGIDDPRLWDPTSLSFLPGQPVDADGLLVKLPATPEFIPEDGFTLNEPDPAFRSGPFVSPPWEYESTPIPLTPTSCESPVVYLSISELIL